MFLSGISLLLLSSPKVSRRGAFGNQLFSVSVSFPNIIVFLSSFPRVVVGNLFLSLLFPYNFLGWRQLPTTQSVGPETSSGRRALFVITTDSRPLRAGYTQIYLLYKNVYKRLFCLNIKALKGEKWKNLWMLIVRSHQADVIPQGMHLYMVLNPSSAKSLNAPVGTVFCMGQDKCAKIGGAEYQICRYGSAQTPCYKLPN